MSEEPRVRGQRGPSDEELRTAVPRDQGGREVRVGIFVVLGVLAVVASIFLLTDPGSLRGRYILVTAMPDAGGIRRGDPVLMRGVNIGRIHGFEMTPAGLVDISMEVEGQWTVPRDSYTRLAGAGLFGGRTMEIIRGASPEMAEPNDTLPGLGEAGGIMETAERLSHSAEDVLTQVNKVLDDDMIGSVRGSATELRGLLDAMRALTAVQRTQLATLTTSLNRTAAGIESSGPAAARVMARVDSAALALNRTSTTLDRAVASLEGVLARMDAGEGTLGRLSRDDSLYVNLNRAVAEIGSLAADIQANPRKYLNLQLF